MKERDTKRGRKHKEVCIIPGHMFNRHISPFPFYFSLIYSVCTLLVWLHGRLELPRTLYSYTSLFFFCNRFICNRKVLLYIYISKPCPFPCYEQAISLIFTLYILCLSSLIILLHILMYLSIYKTKKNEKAQKWHNMYSYDETNIIAYVTIAKSKHTCVLLGWRSTVWSISFFF